MNASMKPCITSLFVSKYAKEAARPAAKIEDWKKNFRLAENEFETRITMAQQARAAMTGERCSVSSMGDVRRGDWDDYGATDHAADTML